MSAQHTPTRLALSFGRIHSADRTELTIANIARAFDGDFSEANARRLVACWNACEGVPTELLEAYPAPFTELRTQRDELLAALSRIAKWNEHTTEFAVDFGSNGVRDFYRGIASRAIRAIAKVKGGAV